MIFKNDDKGMQVDAEAVNTALTSLTYSRRRTLRDAVEATKFNMSTLWNFLKRGDIKRHSNTFTPLLIDANKISRLQWALSHIDKYTLRFNSMHDVVHLDEKWFYLSEATGTFYLSEDAPLPRYRPNRSAFYQK